MQDQSLDVGIACPHCGRGRLQIQEKPDGDTVCPECGHRASAALVAEEAWLLGEKAKLEARLGWVQAQLVTGSVDPPAPVQAPARQPVTAQTILLGGGALLLVTAAIVFAAVAWDRLGAAGQLTLLALVVGALSTAAHGLRHNYRATAETLAAVAAAVAAVALLAAPDLGLGPDWMRERDALWATIAFLSVAMLSFAQASASRLVAWHIALVVAAGGSALAACYALAGERGYGPAPLAVAGLAAIGAILTVRSTGTSGSTEQVHPVAADDVRWFGRICAVLALLLALRGYADSERYVSWAFTWAVIAGGAAVVVVKGGRTPIVGSAATLVAGAAAGHVPVFLAAAVNRWTATLLIAAAVLGAALLVVGLSPRWFGPSAPDAGKLGLRRGCLAAAVTVWLLAPPMLRVVAAGLVGGYLAVIAACLFWVAVALRRDWSGWLGAAIGTASAWVLLADHGIGTVAGYTLASATLLLAAGGITGRHGERGSTIVLGPALAMALLPSSVAAFADTVDAAGRQGLVRSVVVLVVAVAVAIAGALARLRAPLLVGSAAALIVAAGQLYALADLVPRWIALGAAGAALVVAGFMFEALSRAGRHAWQRARALS